MSPEKKKFPYKCAYQQTIVKCIGDGGGSSGRGDGDGDG